MTASGDAVPTAPAFAHASEAELSRILDFYDVRWEYEPHTFPVLWSLDGTVLESFSPDFYLPDLDLYLELTTLKQSLVRKKNRKLRRLRELYPDIRIKLFYARDFRMLMLKFGRVALVDALSGTSGHVFPERAEQPTEGRPSKSDDSAREVAATNEVAASNEAGAAPAVADVPVTDTDADAAIASSSASSRRKKIRIRKN